MGDGLTDEGPAGPGREAPGRRGPLQFTVQPAGRPRPGDDHAPLVLGDDLGQAGRVRRGPAVVPVVSVGVARPGLGRGHGHGAQRFEGFAQRPVEMHGAGVGARGQFNRSLGPPDRGVNTGRNAGITGHGEVDAPASGRPVQAHLVDRLGRAPAAQLRRAVSGAHDNWDAGMGGLHYRGQVVGRGGAGCAHEHGRPPGGPAQAEGEEARGTLVELYPRADAGLGVEAQGQRTRSRARADHRVGHPQRGQPGREGGHDVVDRVSHDQRVSAPLAVSQDW